MEKRGLPLIKCRLIYLLNYPLETKWGSLFFAEFSRFSPLVPLQQFSAKWMFVRDRRSCQMKYNVSVTWNHCYYGSWVLNALDNWAWQVMGAGKRNLPKYVNRIHFDGGCLGWLEFFLKYYLFFVSLTLKYKSIRGRQHASYCNLQWELEIDVLKGRVCFASRERGGFAL